MVSITAAHLLFIRFIKGNQLDHHGPLEYLWHLIENLIEILLKLALDPVQVLNGETHQVRWLRCHHSELSLKLILVDEPLIEADLVLEARPKDIDNAKSVSKLMVQKDLVFKLWEHQSTSPTGENVDVVDWISFEIDVLVVLEVHWLQKGTNPSQESAFLVFYDVELFIHVFVDVN